MIVERQAIVDHLRADYSGVFSEEAIQRHVGENVEFGPARQQLDLVLARTGPIATCLDIGCGYGAFVLAARDRGMDAGAVELAPFEVDVARRLASERPGDDGEGAYRLGNARALPFPDSSLDLVTLWNVLEHVEDSGLVLSEAVRVLAPAGACWRSLPTTPPSARRRIATCRGCRSRTSGWTSCARPTRSATRRSGVRSGDSGRWGSSRSPGGLAPGRLSPVIAVEARKA